MIRAFLTILSNALKEFSNVTPEYYFRLADWTHYACAIAKALGIPQKEFMGAYAGKVQLQHEEAINASPIATVLLAYCKDVLKNKEKAVWEGTATQLLGDLVEKARPLKSESRENWPKSASALSRGLNRVSDALLAVGCIVIMKEGTPRRVTINAENVDSPPKQRCVKCDKFHDPKCSFPSGPWSSKKTVKPQKNVETSRSVLDLNKTLIAIYDYKVKKRSLPPKVPRMHGGYDSKKGELWKLKLSERARGILCQRKLSLRNVWSMKQRQSQKLNKSVQSRKQECLNRLGINLKVLW